MAAIPLLHDCDPGHDDAVAILLALGSPAVDLLGITTTFGNCAVADAARNAASVLTLAGRSDIPVAVGASRPLVGTAHLGNYVHGTSGLDGPPMPEPAAPPLDQDAVAFLADTLRAAARDQAPVTIAATGPITNVARLLQEHPECRAGIAEIIFMGGSTERGNHTPAAEFNAYADPEALAVVLESGLPIRMVGLNVTHQALATTEVVEQMAAIDHPIGRTCAAWMGFFGGSYERIWEFSAPPVHDPCTIAALIDPGVIRWRPAFVAVELDGTWTRGATVVDLYGRYPDRAPNLQVAMALDVKRYWDLVLTGLERLAART